MYVFLKICNRMLTHLFVTPSVLIRSSYLFLNSDSVFTIHLYIFFQKFFFLPDTTYQVLP